MKTLKLNTEKIKAELIRIDRKQVWLANQMGVSRASLSYMLKSRSVRAANRIGHALRMEPKDLIKQEESP